ncbi:MAG: tetratricopeptide repeat protein [bacterium]
MAALAPTFRAPFVYDDYPYLVENGDLAGSLARVPRLFTVSFPSQAPERGLYRPVTALSLRLDRLGGAASPARSHAANVLLVGALVVAVWALLRRIASPAAAAAGTLLFAVHPVHVEPFAWVAGRAEILAAIFACVSLAALSDFARAGGRGRALAGALALLAGILSKENAVVALPLLGLLVLLERPRPARWKAALSAAGAAVVIALGARLAVLHGLGPTAGHIVSPAGLAARGPLIVAAAGEHLRLLVWPHPLFLERMPHAPLAWSEPSVLEGALALAATLLVLVATRRRPELFALAAWPVVALVPVMHFVPIGETVAERFLVLPSVGACALAGALLVGGPRAIRWRTGLLAVLVAAGLAATTSRARVWGDEAALWRDAVVHEPASALAHAALGDALARRGDEAGAEAAYRGALGLDAGLTVARLALAQVLDRQGRAEAALEETREAVAHDPEHPIALNHLGARLARVGRVEEAIRCFRRAVEVAPGYGAALRNLAAASLETGRPEEARALLARARAADPSLPGLDDLAARLDAFRAGAPAR